MEDKLLVFRCKRGSRKALARIYYKYKADLLLLAMALLNDRSAAEDVVHDVFASFVRGLDAFRLTGSLKGYLLTCVANHARNCNKAEGGCAGGSDRVATGLLSRMKVRRYRVRIQPWSLSYATSSFSCWVVL